MLQDNNQPLHLASNGGHIETARMLLERGAPVDAVGQVSAWECGLVQEHGDAWESAGLLETEAVCGVLRRGATGGRC